LKYAAIDELSFGSGNDNAITVTSSSACGTAKSKGRAGRDTGFAADRAVTGWRRRGGDVAGWRAGAGVALRGRDPAFAAAAVFAFALILLGFLLAWAT
jgi:uncharacterized protein (DUF1501 family)